MFVIVAAINIAKAPLEHHFVAVVAKAERRHGGLGGLRGQGAIAVFLFALAALVYRVGHGFGLSASFK
jgi:hypothetical protein